VVATSCARGVLLFVLGLAVGGCVTKPPAPSPSGDTSVTRAGGGPQGSTGTGSGQSTAAGETAAAAGSAQPSPALAAVPAGAAGSAAGGGARPARAQTDAERRAGIERQLDDSIGSFDATIKKEQERLARERDARAAAVDPSAENVVKRDPGPRPRGDAAGAEGAGEDEPGAGGSRGGDLESSAPGTNAGGNSGNGASAREIPDGSDDDIVARRLRKAAQQETDPELKEKLWKEYVEYKKSGQTK